MSYPQPNSNTPARNGADFFRLNTPLVSPGDIYETEQGAHAFAIGPESDLANVAIDYFDDSVSPTFMNSVKVSTQRSMVGLISASPGSGYQPSNVPGRTLIRPTDLYNPALDLATVLGFPIDANFFVAPQLDVIQYFADQPSLVPQRSDKTFEFQRIGGGVSGTYTIVLPCYGRKRATYRWVNNAAVNQSFGIAAINYTLGDNNNGYRIGAFIAAVASLAPGVQVNGVVDTTIYGAFDALVAVIATSGNHKFALRVDVSDS